MTQPSSSPKLPSASTYNKLKFTAQILLPGIGALYFSLAQIWGLPNAGEVNGTIAILNVFIGVIVTWLKSIFDASGPQYDGQLTWEDNEDGSILRMTSLDIKALDNNGQVLLKVVRPKNE